MPRRREHGRGFVVALLTASVALLGGLVLQVAVAGAMPVRGARADSPRIAANTAFRPRVGSALGLVPAHGAQEIATATNIPVVYHGGSVMRDVTIHTVFWAPAGYGFDGSPGGATLGYEALIQQFFVDIAHDSGGGSNVFSVLPQYGDHGGSGGYRINYDPATDSVLDTQPYPGASQQCASPSGVATCVTDLELQRELDRVIGPNSAAERGLSNIWFVLLPPDVDTCTEVGVCGTNAYAGYHSAFELGAGETVYAAIPDPLIEYTPPPGNDPEGNPEAESTIDTMAHETVEAITDPLGTGWMDPNGFETGDKCENGPQTGAPLGFASDGSPYNQVIDGHQYLIQDMWSDARNGCVQSSAAPGRAPSLHEVRLKQFSSSVSGDTGVARSVPVLVKLSRAHKLVATAHGQTSASGSWGPLTLRDRAGLPHAVGDDRDLITVEYGSPKHQALAPDVIATGDGGNPFTESGWTGWFDLDHGYAIQSQGPLTLILIGPCSQTGTLSLRIGSRSSTAPTELCETESDAAVLPLGRLGAGTPLSLSSEDNRAVTAREPDGALVRMTVPLGEPNSLTSVRNGQLLYKPTGFPTCTALQRIRTIRCTGLVRHGHYRLMHGGRTIGHGRAGSAGAVTIGGLSVHGGDVVTLVDSAGRRLTSLHIAHLRVSIIGEQTTVASGSCQPGEYWGPPVAAPPVSSAIGTGIVGAGRICPLSGSAAGMPATQIAQTDEFSGGETETQVPLVQSTSPIQDETLYGSFVASAQSGLPGPHGSISASGVPISLTIKRAGAGGRTVFHAANVDTPAGISVAALAPGAYVARWMLRDAAGDTRTVTTRFVDLAG
ncbi:MAG: hypothetical protein ACRDMJ_06410 [Solirubrobacteraceae bacterium]